MTLLTGPDRSAADATECVACRVVLVDGQQIFRQAVHALLCAEPGFVVVGEAGRLAEALEAVGTHSPDLVLSDLKLPDSADMQLIPQLRARCPQAAFVVLTALQARDHVAAARKAGALGYLPKQRGRLELLTAIRSVLAGRRYRTGLPRSARHGSDRSGRGAGGAALLTERQRQVLRSLALGHRAREIAATLGVSVRAVYKQRERLRETLQLNSTAALTRFAAYEGFTEDGSAQR
ncbi:MAG TPA: response regulator transcription factor [Steroidobacteraceae bacterium]|nr:response regulator transcription factor [Steroidobacteraceae bacterium]